MTVLAYPNFQLSRGKVVSYQWDRLFLVTICGLGPCVLRLDDVGGDDEAAIELVDVRFGRCSLSDAQA